MSLMALDIESTGTDPSKDRIVQIAIAELGGTTTTYLCNPGIPIPQEATAVHGITDAQVASLPRFDSIADWVKGQIENNAVVTFNGNSFDVRLLCEEFARFGVDFNWRSVTWIDVGTLCKIHNPRTLGSMVRQYLGREHEGAHDAAADAAATLKLFAAVVERHQIPLDLNALSLETNYGKVYADPFGNLVMIDGHMCYGTRRNKDVRVEDDIGYALWMLRSDFPTCTKVVLEEEMQRLAYLAQQKSDAIVSEIDQMKIPF